MAGVKLPSRQARRALVLALPLAVGGCGSLEYYWQSASGHLALMAASRPVPDWLQDEAAPEPLKLRLEKALRIRAFASRELQLPDNASYRRYADLHRPAAVWNVVAAPEFSLTLHTWCFPVTGCVGYRGWFDQAQAQAEAASLRQQGLEAAVYPVPAYSTLGWMNWAGGDPLLNTFIHYPEGELARLLFHELAHQVVYVRDDTLFNESFATAVERLGVQRWLETEASEATRREWGQVSARRAQFRALTRETRGQLEAVYATPGLPDGERRARKDAVLREFRIRYAGMRAQWGGDSSRLRLTDRWVAEANNASFGAQAAYDRLVPGFEALFAREGGDWRRFYAAVKDLSALPRPVRHQRLDDLARARPTGSS
jgi:predicted aminopeptidase